MANITQSTRESAAYLGGPTDAYASLEKRPGAAPPPRNLNGSDIRVTVTVALWCGIPGPLESPALNCPRSSSFNEIENVRFPNGLPLIRGWPR